MRSTKKEVLQKQSSAHDRFWTLQVAPKQRTCLANDITFGMMVVQNNGPGIVKIVSSYLAPAQLAPGQLRIVRIAGDVHIECTDDQYSSLQFEFSPSPK